MLGLPEHVRACLFDLDGVLTRTARVHAAAWKQTFDDFLRRRSERTGDTFAPFDSVADYDAYVDGLPRADGIRSFLTARGITLPEGSPEDGPGEETVTGLGLRKNDLVLRLLREQGVDRYDSSVDYVRAARDAGLRRAVVSSSTNCRAVLAAAGIEELFEVRIDGNTAREKGLHGKPAPDGYLAAARALDVPAEQAAVFEDALAGVEAGRAGGLGHVVGVDRTGQAAALRAHGADLVVADLAELLENRR